MLLKFTFAAMKEKVINSAIQTIRAEALAVEKLANYINDEFAEIITVLKNCKGRIVIAGIGKSAIVGEKIVATLNSTGTAALFMHAADAIHGDLGMIQKDDIVLIISKSGESPEIKVLVSFIRSFHNVIIAMVGNTASFLAKQADYILNTTIDKEACPNNLAPTSSTTVQMVMGDAIAVCLMELNQFSDKDFARYHPGGNLGKKLYLRVNDIYIQNEKPVVRPDASLKKVIIEISKGRLGATAVVDEENKVMGIITDGDVRRMLETIDDLRSVTAAAIVTPNPRTIESGKLAVEALEILKKHDISQLIVEDEGEYKGIIHLHDLIREGII